MPELSLRGTTILTEIYKIGTWTSNYIFCSVRNVIAHPCLSFNGGLTKPPLNLEH